MRSIYFTDILVINQYLWYVCSMQKISCCFTLQLTMAKRQYSYLHPREIIKMYIANLRIIYKDNNLKFNQVQLMISSGLLKTQSSISYYIWKLIKLNIYNMWLDIIQQIQLGKNLNHLILCKATQWSSDLHDSTGNGDGMQIVNLNTASFAGLVRLGLSATGIHLVLTEYGLDVLGRISFSPKVNHSTSVYAQ